MSDRQPVHTVYGGAQLFRPDTVRKLGAVATQVLNTYAPDFETFSTAVGEPNMPRAAYDRVLEKLRTEPVEDFRIDFEDGYGTRNDAEEDGHAVAAARAVESAVLPPFFGIRIKPLTDALRARGLRTLELFLKELKSVPEGFIVTLPKVTSPGQVAELVREIPAGASIEIMVETPEAIVDASGRFAIPALLDAAEGRCRALHFGAYDYTSNLEITAESLALDHPSCDFARHIMQICAVPRGVFLSDGATGLMPVPRHRPAEGKPLTEEQMAENRASVHEAMRDHFGHVQRALRRGYYQGWDLHPGQIPTRYAAVYTFFLRGFDAAAARLRNFLKQAAQATTVGSVFDDAATGQGLLNFFLRGVNCGAFSEQDTAAAGLTIEELHSKSFPKILAGRT